MRRDDAQRLFVPPGGVALKRWGGVQGPAEGGNFPAPLATEMRCPGTGRKGGGVRGGAAPGFCWPRSAASMRGFAWRAGAAFAAGEPAEVRSAKSGHMTTGHNVET